MAAAVCRWAAVASALFVLAPFVAGAQGYGESSQHGGGSWSGYQRKSHSSHPWKNDWKRGDRFRQTGPNISAGSFQRPYPYHLDYYKMRYGGSYAPYFGNLYGPPTFVGAPFYGGFGGYGTFNPYLGYGYDGFDGGYNGYPPGGVGYPANYPAGGCVGPYCPDATAFPAAELPNGEVVEGGAPIVEP